jgi:hypothetical protein
MREFYAFVWRSSASRQIVLKDQTYFVFGGAYYRPFYSGSSVIYEVVAKPA